MQTEKFILNEERNVTLTSYIQDISPEMKHLDKRPAILVLPGGGYFMCSDREAEPVALAYLAEGYNAFVLRYSILEHSTFPNPLDDACKAISFIRENAEKFNILPDKVAAIGFSAGGHLCAALSTMGEEKPNACVLGYPCILDYMSKHLPAPIPSLDDKISSETPPTFIFAASDDGAVPLDNSLKFALGLDKYKIPYELHIFQKGNHGFSTGTSVVVADSKNQEICKPTVYWVQRSIDWLYDIFNKE